LPVPEIGQRVLSLVPRRTSCGPEALRWQERGAFLFVFRHCLRITSVVISEIPTETLVHGRAFLPEARTMPVEVWCEIESFRRRLVQDDEKVSLCPVDVLGCDAPDCLAQSAQSYHPLLSQRDGQRAADS